MCNVMGLNVLKIYHNHNINMHNTRTRKVYEHLFSIFMDSFTKSNNTFYCRAVYNQYNNSNECK